VNSPPVTSAELGGSGAPIDLTQPFVVVLQHPDTRYTDDAYSQMVETLEGVRDAGYPAVCFWPGQDAGAGGLSKAIRERQAVHHTVRNLPPRRFLRLLTQAAVLVGNSSAGIREAGYLGTPVVNVGLRQFSRERAENVLDGPHDREWIHYAIEAQVNHGKYPSSNLYGNGTAGPRIAEVLAHVSARIDSCPVRF
jgi:UDP-N-acetylglucosamine 2-epimerase